MRSVWVRLGRGYQVLVEGGLLGRLGGLIPKGLRLALVSTPRVLGLHGEKALEALSPHRVFTLPDGEEAKSWEAVEELIHSMVESGFGRDTLVVALGGGALGDAAGFAASIYMRGVPVVQVPTTLLSMVDSCLGGKTAINLPLGKNLVGSFHQPSLVACDPQLLETLPSREVASGVAEAVKTGVVGDTQLFSLLEEGLKPTPGNLEEVVFRSCAVKARFVEQDERDEVGVRAALNLGHTLGHALETLTSHALTHGEAVAIGMCFASHLSAHLGHMDWDSAERIRDALRRNNLPTTPLPLDPLAVVEAMNRDKKTIAGRIRLVLPIGIGQQPILKPVPTSTLIEVLEEAQP